MARITNTLVTNLSRILCRTLDLPEHPYVNGKGCPGHIWAGDTGGYGYTVEQTVSEGGARSLASGLTAAEAYQWLQGALETARLIGVDGPIAERWTGTGVYPAPYGALVRYLGPTDHKGSRWVATISRDGEHTRAYVPYTDGPIAAAIAAETKYAASINVAPRKPTTVIHLTPDCYAVGF
jgi:hypothetical protein